MKAAVVYRKNEIRIVDVPRPEAGKGEVVVKVRASGICATDVKILGGAGIPADLPAILGMKSPERSVSWARGPKRPGYTSGSGWLSIR